MGPVNALAVDIDGALGDTRGLWQAWLEDVARRLRIDDLAEADLDERVGNWQVLVERFASDHAPVYLRPSAEAAAALRRLQAGGVRLGGFSESPEPLVRVALAHLGAARRLDVVECGPGALDRLLAELGPDTPVARSADELRRAAA